MGCEYCDASFSSRRDEINHMLDEHDDELTSHDRDELKRERNKLQDDGNGRNHHELVKTAGIGVVAVLLFAGVGYALMSAGYISFSTDAGPGGSGLGAPGSTHEHASIRIVLDGERVNLAAPEYAHSDNIAHIHDGQQGTLHKHATGATYGYFLDTLDMDVYENEAGNLCFEMDDGETYCDNESGDLTVAVNGQDVQEMDSSLDDREIQDGDDFSIRYTSTE